MPKNNIPYRFPDSTDYLVPFSSLQLRILPVQANHNCGRNTRSIYPIICCYRIMRKGDVTICYVFASTETITFSHSSHCSLPCFTYGTKKYREQEH
jgi:hypothetical protein